VQSFFIRSRNSWIAIANRLAVIGDATSVHYEEAWDSIMAGTAGAEEEFRKMSRTSPHRVQWLRPS
jgi:hypothetical protein